MSKSKNAKLKAPRGVAAQQMVRQIRDALKIMAECESDLRTGAKSQEKGSAAWRGFYAKADAYRHCENLLRPTLPND